MQITQSNLSYESLRYVRVGESTAPEHVAWGGGSLVDLTA